MAAKTQSRLLLVSFGILSLFCGHLCQPRADKCKGKIDKCYCTDYVIDCVGHTFTDLEEIYPYITNKTYRISITNGKISHLPSNLFQYVADWISVEKLLNVEYLNLSGNEIVGLHTGAFNLVPNLATLDLSNNSVQLFECDKEMSVAISLKDLKVLKKLNLRKTFNEHSLVACDVGNLVQSLNLTQLEFLDVSHNGFANAGKKFTDFVNKAYNLRHLNMAHNALTEVVYGLGFGNIVEYDLSYNQLLFITALETDELENMPMLSELKLGGNPFSCDCRMNDALEWLNNTEQPLDFDDIVCKFSDNELVIGKPIRSLNVDDICGEPRIVICPGPYGPIAVAQSTAWVIFVAAGILILVCIVSIVMYIRYRGRRNSEGQRSTATTTHAEKSPAYSRMV